MSSLGIVDWKRTSSQYVAILQSLDRFEPNSIREVSRSNGEIILAGVLKGTNETDWYALAYDRNEFEFDEARTRARAALDRYRAANRVAY